MVRRALLATSTAALLLAAAPAGARIPAEEKAREFELGAGLFFNAGGSFMDEPKDKMDESGTAQIVYNGFGGYNHGAGLALEFRYKGFIGLELDFVRSGDEAKTESGGVDVYIEQTSLHVPLLLKATLPVGIVRPNLFVGLDFVSPGTPTTTTSVPVPGFEIRAHAESYTLFAFGFGFEFAIPVEDLDFRIPLNFRGFVNPDTPDAARDRLELTNEGGVLVIDYSSEWQYHAAVTLGLSYHFL